MVELKMTTYLGPDSRLDAFFPSPDPEHRFPARDRYSERDIQDISALLRNISPTGSRVPRTYIVLRVIDQLHLLDGLINEGFTDHWFPVPAGTLLIFLV